MLDILSLDILNSRESRLNDKCGAQERVHSHDVNFGVFAHLLDKYLLYALMEIGYT
jgi:hypothetical protein